MSHDETPSSISAPAGMARHLQLLTVLTMSNELSDTEFETDEQVVARALSIYRSAKAAGSAALMQEHVQSWAELWRGGEHDRLRATFFAGLLTPIALSSRRHRAGDGRSALATDDQFELVLPAHEHPVGLDPLDAGALDDRSQCALPPRILCKMVDFLDLSRCPSR